VLDREAIALEGRTPGVLLILAFGGSRIPRTTSLLGCDRPLEPASLSTESLLVGGAGPPSAAEVDAAMISGDIPPCIASFDGRGICDIGLAPAFEADELPLMDALARLRAVNRLHARTDRGAKHGLFEFSKKMSSNKRHKRMHASFYGMHL
jgi:hypothetical protein